MKAGTLNHVKTKRLKRKLGIPLYQAAGILESLWQLSAECADDGAIGKYSDEEIASHLEWEHDPGELIQALLDCRWLDKDDDARLLIHDWFDHAPNYIKDRIRKRVQREITTYDDKTRDKQRNVPGLSDTPRDKSTPVAINPSHPNPTQPIPGNPNPPCAAKAAGCEEAPPAREEISPEELPQKAPRKRAAPDAAEIRAEDLPLPPALEHPEFLDVWSQWITYRRGRRVTTREDTMLRQLKELAPLGPAEAARVLEKSMRNGWSGIFPEKDRSNGNPRVGPGQRYAGD